MPTEFTDLRAGGHITTLAELPEAAQLALTHYMALDGEAWDRSPEFEELSDLIWLEYPELEDPDDHAARAFLFREALRSDLPYLVSRYGEFRIGYHPCILTVDLVTSVMNSPEIHADFEDWASYHNWYISHTIMPEYDAEMELWPVILSSFEDETLEDGTHRFHHYVRSGVKCIPALFYLD